MSKAKVVFYSRKEVAQLRAISKLTGRSRTNALKSWCSTNNRKYGGAYAKMAAVMKASAPARIARRKIVVNSTSKHSSSVLKIPIKTIEIVDNHLVITT